MASYIFFLGAELASEYPRVLRGDYTVAEPTEPRSLLETAVGTVQGLFVAKRENVEKPVSPPDDNARG